VFFLTQAKRITRMESTFKFTDWRKRIPQCLQMLLLDAKRIENDVILPRIPYATDW